MEWLISEDNSGMAVYTSDTRMQRKRIEGAERARSKIISEMLDKLKENNLLPDAFQNVDEQED